jgi:hypothetical protein
MAEYLDLGMLGVCKPDSLKIVPRVTEYKSDLMGVQIRLN